MEKEIYIKNRNGLKMAVKLNIDNQRTKLVFLEHGLGARKEYPHMKVMEDIFAEYGYNVINIDATNSLNASECSKEGITFTGHYQDLEDVIEWAKTQEFYREPFALAGQNLGAASCVNFAGQYPQMVDLLLIAACPFIDGYELINKDEMMMYIEKNGFLDKVSRSTGKTLRINKIFNDDVKIYNFTQKIRKIKAKAYVIQGLLDEGYIIENNKMIYKMLNCQKQHFLLPNVPHDLANTLETKAIFEKALRKIMEEQKEVTYETRY